jgi:hypothetical protein
MDSTMVASNILDMSRLQLLVEALQRMYRALSEADQQRYAETFPTVDPVLEQRQVEQIPSGIRGSEPEPGKLNLADFELEPAESGLPEKITRPQGHTVSVTTSNHKKGLQSGRPLKAPSGKLSIPTLGANYRCVGCSP